MAKVTAPALSMGGSGQIGKTMTFANWRGVNYVKQYVVPSNPRSTGQQQTRGVFAWSTATWKSAGTLFKASWTSFAKGKPLTDRNAFIGANVKALRTATVLTDLVFSPGSGGGLPPTSSTGVGAAGQITVNTVNPAAPAGWTIQSMVAFATMQGDPHVLSMSTIVEGQDSATFNSVVLSGLAAGAYVYGAILVWTKADGTVAYSVASTGTATVT